MKNRFLPPIYLAIFTACTTVAVYGQPAASAAFAELDAQVKSRGGWNPDVRLAEWFNLGRRRLGDRFEPELLKYQERDLDKHYWVSLYLEDQTYLQGAPPLPHLSLLIKQQALALLEGKGDDESLSDVTRLSVTAAVLSERLGLHDLAASHKARAEQLIRRKRQFEDAVLALTAEERNLYNAVSSNRAEPVGPNGPDGRTTPLKGQISAAKTDNSSPKILRVSGGVLQGTAIRKVQPTYPADARAARISGTVKIRVVVSREGEVVEADCIEGPEQLREPSLEAARQWLFKPTIIAGEPVGVTGILTFNFAMR